MGIYKAYGNRVCMDEYFDLRATTANSSHAIRAAEMLNKARWLNDHKRRYTAAAKLIAEVESTIPGFTWIEQ